MNNLYLMAALGALVLEVIKIIENKYNPSLPGYLTKLNFWLAFVGQVFIGILTFYLLKNQVNNSIGALTCGFSGATILTKLLSKADLTPRGNPGESFNNDEKNKEKSIFWYWK